MHSSTGRLALTIPTLAIAARLHAGCSLTIGVSAALIAPVASISIDLDMCVGRFRVLNSHLKEGNIARRDGRK